MPTAVGKNKAEQCDYVSEVKRLNHLIVKKYLHSKRALLAESPFLRQKITDTELALIKMESIERKRLPKHRQFDFRSNQHDTNIVIVTNYNFLFVDEIALNH